MLQLAEVASSQLHTEKGLLNGAELDCEPSRKELQKWIERFTRTVTAQIVHSG